MVIFGAYLKMTGNMRAIIGQITVETSKGKC